ncbi:MAG: 50S ribosome-binding GTPase [Planctomycetales bacterium]|nr:50S ribosome-binding GTPase [Planctomycetales bacterium]
MNRSADTVVVLLTPRGRSAVATVRVEGPAALAATDRLFHGVRGCRIEAAMIGAVMFGRWGDAHGEGVVLVRVAEATVEVHCHGGAAASRAIVDSLHQLGCAEIDWFDWIAAQDAVPIRCAAFSSLLQARSERTAEILLDQYHGALQRKLAQIADQLRAGELALARASIDRLLQLAPLGMRLIEPWKVCLVGEPNVGKSSLLNQIVGFERAIVFDQPGTTRDALGVEIALDGWPVRLFDTAGLRQAEDEIEQAGIARTVDHVASADLLLNVIDCSRPRSEQDLQSVFGDCPRLDVANKIDCCAEAYAEGYWPTNALTGEGVAALCAAVIEELVPTAPDAGEALPFLPAHWHGLEVASLALNRNDLAEAGKCLLRLLDAPGAYSGGS